MSIRILSRVVEKTKKVSFISLLRPIRLNSQVDDVSAKKRKGRF